MKFNKGDTVKSLMNYRFCNRKGFVEGFIEDVTNNNYYPDAITVGFCGNNLLFNNHELARTRMILIEKNKI